MEFPGAGGASSFCSPTDGVLSVKRITIGSFYINLPVGGVALGVIALFFRMPDRAKPVSASLVEKIKHLDLPGATILIAAVVCFLLDMQWGGATKSWGSGAVVGTLVAAGVLTVIFVGVQIWQGEMASLVPRILKRRVIYGICTFVFL